MALRLTCPFVHHRSRRSVLVSTRRATSTVKTMDHSLGQDASKTATTEASQDILVDLSSLHGSPHVHNHTASKDTDWSDRAESARHVIGSGAEWVHRGECRQAVSPPVYLSSNMLINGAHDLNPIA